MILACVALIHRRRSSVPFFFLRLKLIRWNLSIVAQSKDNRGHVLRRLCNLSISIYEMRMWFPIHGHFLSTLYWNKPRNGWRFELEDEEEKKKETNYNRIEVRNSNIRKKNPIMTSPVVAQTNDTSSYAVDMCDVRSIRKYMLTVQFSVSRSCAAHHSSVCVENHRIGIMLYYILRHKTLFL